MKRNPSVVSLTFLTSTAVWVVLGFRVGILSLTLGGEVHAQAILNVDAGAIDPTQNGFSWCNGYLELAPALNAASAGTTIRVADGEFHADPVGFLNPRRGTFQLKNGVTLEGAYTDYWLSPNAVE